MSFIRFRKKLCIIFSIILIVTFAFPTNALALTPSTVSSTAIRNRISNSWSYKARGYYENNCLAWALGNTTSWIWPWGSKNPTVAQVTSYLATRGYEHTGNKNMSQKIYAFGSTSSVTHFSKGLGNGPLATPQDAKWGHYEVFNHHSPDPYNSVSSGSYGPRVASYNTKSSIL